MKKKQWSLLSLLLFFMLHKIHHSSQNWWFCFFIHCKHGANCSSCRFEGLRCINPMGVCLTGTQELVWPCDIKGKRRKLLGEGGFGGEITIKQRALWYSQVSSLWRGEAFQSPTISMIRFTRSFWGDGWIFCMFVNSVIGKNLVAGHYVSMMCILYMCLCHGPSVGFLICGLFTLYRAETLWAPSI